jgi:sugar phosphate isomerase/epimerase
MIQLGEGQVDFQAIFARLKQVGFQGPIMLEGCTVGKTPEETTQNARANRLFLEKIIAGL